MAGKTQDAFESFHNACTRFGDTVLTEMRIKQIAVWISKKTKNDLFDTFETVTYAVMAIIIIGLVMLAW